jgi:hypothetical protein
MWMDGYSDQQFVWLDDVKPGSIDYVWLLGMCDCYDCSAEVKRGRVRLHRVKEIWITSSFPMENLYPGLDQLDSLKQLKRRITDTIEFSLSGYRYISWAQDGKIRMTSEMIVDTHPYPEDPTKVESESEIDQWIESPNASE